MKKYPYVFITHLGIFEGAECEYLYNGILHPGSIIEIFSSEIPNIAKGAYRGFLIPTLQGIMKECTINQSKILCFVHTNPNISYEAKWCLYNQNIIYPLMDKYKIGLEDIIELSKGNTNDYKLYYKFYFMFEYIIRNSDIKIK